MGEPLDRDVVTRVLRRASELADDGTPPVDGIDEEALVEAADEVGIPVDAVRRAIAVERLGPAPGGRLGDVVLGRSIVVVDAELPGPAVRRDGPPRRLAGRRPSPATGAAARGSGRMGQAHGHRRDVDPHRALGPRRPPAGPGEPGRGDGPRHRRRVVRRAHRGRSLRRPADDRRRRRRRHRPRFRRRPRRCRGSRTGHVAGGSRCRVGRRRRGVAGRGRASRIEHDVQLVLEAVDQGDRPGRLGTGAMRRAVGR